MGGGGKAGGKGARKRIAGGRKKGIIAEWKGTWGWIKLESPLKHPDAQKTDGKVYLHNGDLRSGGTVTNGAKVEFFVYSDQRGLGAEDVSIIGGKSAAVTTTAEKVPSGWQKLWSAEHKEHYYWHAATKEAVWELPGGDDTGEEDGPLPLGWSKEFDAQSKKSYFWNKSTRTASWTRPTAAATAGTSRGEAQAEEASTVVDPTALGQQRMQGIVTQWQGIFGWVSPLMSKVPDDLKKLLERSQGKIYVNWRDVKDGLKLKVGSHVDFSIYADDNGIAASDVTSHQAGKLSGTVGEKAAEKIQPVSYGVAEVERGADENDGPLLPGWERCWSAEHESHFYWHAESKCSSWDRPAVPGFDENDDSFSNILASKKRIAAPFTPLISTPGRAMTPITPTSGWPNAKRARNF